MIKQACCRILSQELAVFQLNKTLYYFLKSTSKRTSRYVLQPETFVELPILNHKYQFFNYKKRNMSQFLDF